MSNPQPVTHQTMRLSVGALVDDRYEIVDFLGLGGFARVYKARHVHMERMVALKMLNPEPDERLAKAFEKRFLLEAKIAANIRHPNIVTIHDFGFSGPLRQPYIAMELLPGHDLETEIQNVGPLAPQRAIPLALGALDALGAGHHNRIVHKDLKPANLFLSNPGADDEQLVVLDFGVARQEERGQKLTDTGTFNGTPQYLSPEYIQSQTVTPALDVYQMGLILVEMLQGRVVVDKENPYECILAHCSGLLELPSELMATSLGPVLLKALALEPADRYENGYAFRDALASVDVSTIPTLQPEAPTSVHEKATAHSDAEESETGSDRPSQQGTLAVPVASERPSEPRVATVEETPAPPAGSPVEGLVDTVRQRPILLAIPGALFVMLGLGIIVLLLVSAMGSTDEPDETTQTAPTIAEARSQTPPEDLEALTRALADNPTDEELKEKVSRLRQDAVNDDRLAAADKLVSENKYPEALAELDRIPSETPAGMKIRKNGTYQRVRDKAIAQLLDETQKLMVVKQWSEAKKTADQVLAIDPNNRDAADLKREIEGNRPKGGGGWGFFRR